MKIFSIQKWLFIVFALANLSTQMVRADCNAHTIFVPRQMAYNPIYEDALIFDEYAQLDQCLFSIKPIYTQTVGDSIEKYFNINHSCSMNVQENGSGNINSLWFQVIAPPGTYYSSTLSFSPVQKTYGALLYAAWILPEDFAITMNTALVGRKNNMHICETNINSGDSGQMPGFSTLTQAFMSTSMNYGKICGAQSKAGFDDIQIKLLKNFKMCEDESLFGDIYALVGIPTGVGSKAIYLFEPIIGSNHIQCGLGLNAEKSFDICVCDQFSLYSECKWRYSFKAKETRSFDMTPNGQWSRYMLFTTPTTPDADPFFAINDLTFATSITPRNSFDLLLAMHIELNKFSVELGYNFWYRQAEAVCPCVNLPGVGIADLVGISQLSNPIPPTVTTASMATISEGVYPNEYQIPRDASYTLVAAKNINTLSGAQPASYINAVFASVGYDCDQWKFGINTSYEHANSNTASVVSVWANVDVRF